ncbi:MAG: DUF1003 domain-containing protein [Tsuneonella sp.]
MSALDQVDSESLELLAQELLGRTCGDLGEEELTVLAHVAAGNYIGIDAAEAAQLHVSFGDRLADRVAAVGGSWAFIVGFVVLMIAWMALNVLRLWGIDFDPYPFILLNLSLSTLAALQAPIILMSQNRQAAKDRITARHDYEVNLRTQLEILRLSKKIDRMAHWALHVAKEERGQGESD